MSGEDSPVEDLEDLYENAPCGYLSADANGRIVKVNRTFLKWTDYEARDVIGKRFPDLLNVAGRIFYETHFAPLLRMQGFFNEVALDVIKADGDRLAVLANAAERRDDDDHLLVTRMAMFQATQRRRHERALSAALADEKAVAELREQFIAVLGHDLRNPVAAVASGIRILGTEMPSDRAVRVLNLMQASTIRMSGLIDNLLDFARARLGAGITIEPELDKPLEPTLRQVVDELRIGHTYCLIEERYALSQPVAVDHAHIAQMMSNLLANALTHGAEDEPVVVEAATPDGQLVLSVINGGEPIPPHIMKRLFQPFYRGEVRQSQQGLGLGLYIASEIAKAHGGEISVTSSEVETRFTFRMPLPMSKLTP